MHFERMSADELIEARRGQIAAREGAPLERWRTEAWKAGWQFGVKGHTPQPPSWIEVLRDAIPQVATRELEVA